MYVKLFSTITDSTVWSLPATVRVVWVTMLAKCDRHGYLAGSPFMLSKMANLSLPEVEHALALLGAPDPHSRSKEYDGRRITTGPDGWQILNYAKYRAIKSAEERRAYRAEWMRNKRAAEEKTDVNTPVNEREHVLTRVNKCEHIAEADAEADAHKEHPSRDESTPAAVDRIPSPDSLGKTWNENRGSLPAVKLPMSKGRATHAKQRLRETPDLPRWAAAIRRAAASPFCRGDNDRAWVADLDFLLRPDTLAKIEEGKYDPRGGPLPLKAKPKRDFAKEIRELEAVIERMVGEMRQNERECAEMEFAGTLTEQGRANYAMFKENDIDRIRQTRGELEALKQEAARG